MELPNETTVRWFDGFVPDDARVVRGKMFGHVCAFVHGNMFFGTFAQALILRVGERRATELDLPNFEPMPGRPWRDYVVVTRDTVSDARLRELVEEALVHSAGLPPKTKSRGGAKAKAVNAGAT